TSGKFACAESCVPRSHPRAARDRSGPFAPALLNPPIPDAPLLALRAEENPADSYRQIQRKSALEIAVSVAALLASVAPLPSEGPLDDDIHPSAHKTPAFGCPACNRT